MNKQDGERNAWKGEISVRNRLSKEVQCGDRKSMKGFRMRDSPCFDYYRGRSIEVDRRKEKKNLRRKEERKKKKS